MKTVYVLVTQVMYEGDVVEDVTFSEDKAKQWSEQENLDYTVSYTYLTYAVED